MTPSMHRPGFTLIELMVVVTIISILAGLTVIGMGDIVQRARVQRSANSFVQACTVAQEMALADGRSFEITVNSAKALVDTSMSISEYSDFWKKNSTPGGVSGSVHTMSAPAEIWSDKPEDQWFAIIGPWQNSDGRWYQCRGGAGSEPFVDKNNNGVWNTIGEDFLDYSKYNRDTPCALLSAPNYARDASDYWINIGGAFSTAGYIGYSFSRYVFKDNTTNANNKWDAGEPYSDLNGSGNMDSPARSVIDEFITCDPRFCGGRNAAWVTLAYQNALPAPITTGRSNTTNENARTTALNFYPNGTIDRNGCPNVEVFASSGASFDQQSQAWVGICSTKTIQASFQPYRFYTSGAKKGQVEDYGTPVVYQRPVAMLWISLSQAGDVVVGSSPRTSP